MFLLFISTNRRMLLLNPALRKFIYPFLLPNGLLCGLVLVLLGQDLLPTQLHPFLKVFPYVVVATGLLLGWRFNRTRLICAILLLLLVDIYFSYLTEIKPVGLAFQIAALLLPLNLLLISWFRERGLLNFRIVFWGLFLLVQLSGSVWLIKGFPVQGLHYLTYPLIHHLKEIPLALGQPVLLANLLVLLLFGVRFICRFAAFEVSFFWAQILLFAGFLGWGEQPLRFFLASAGLVLILGIMETSHSLAYRDELTGLPGRRALNEALAKLGNKYTFAMLDIDHFKKFNDKYGHDIGDQVLKMVASRLAGAVVGGKVFRYGGEEFSVIFPRKSVKEALPFLELLRVAVEDARFIPRGKDRPKKKPKQKPARKKNHAAELRVTISIGAAERSAKLDTTDAVLKAADQALYRAKKAGRNRTCR